MVQWLDELAKALKPTLRFWHRAPQGIAASGQRLGVFSGSFNPPTVAHVRLCEHAERHLRLDEIVWLLTVVNVDKPLFGFPLTERLAMMTAVAQERSNWSVAACSHGRFFEKAQAVADAYPTGTQIWFLVGYDTLVRIFEPRFYPDLPMAEALRRFFALARLAVMPRGDADETAVQQFLHRPEVRPFADRIVVLPLDPSIRWISSTLVRQRLERGELVDDLVPSAVAKFLAKG
ncbi:MAG: nicotinate-nicotinamide nucleotide adenylyltransferase [Armatimonadota bacterium]|jgi:nicotinic acid mononucleotide adenylyltransferase|nr:nicotinate-nicotinamide nucleotide adenylyltransferase [Armatimonadota bacterium]MDT7971654.1 nicotinate-nicotinamide nucleotide adenylyltransferase [Armatimonadota bacterium]